ncbi:MAG: chromosomal replication initiator protein DnaA [Lachnospiraceae bacterium]|nr:chromosomal replication initiator protein DnaA [Lachnospiraceae bacterium]
MIIEEKWNEILSFMREEFEITEVPYNTWLAPLKPLALADGKLYVYASDNPLVIGIITKKYKDLLAVAIQALTKMNVEPVFVDSEGAPKVTKTKPEDEDPYIKAAKEAKLNMKYTFEQFVSGKFNELAHAAALAVAENPGEDFKILYIYGGVGLGKTHLMQAIAHYILKKDPTKKILYCSSETFTNDYIESIKKGDKASTSNFRNKYRHEPDVLMIDDIQFIADKEGTQEEFFHTFNELYSNNKQIVITSDKPPKDINNLEDRIRSRFEGGMVADIRVPDYETRMAILRKKEEAEGVELPEEVIKFIATNIKSNIRILEGALRKLLLRRKLTNEEITVEMAEECLKDMIRGNDGPEPVSAQKIINVVCDHFNIPEKEFLSQRKIKEIAFPRQIAMYLCCENLEVSQKAIGKILGGRDHSTIIHGRDKIIAEMRTDPQLRNTIETLNKKLK